MGDLRVMLSTLLLVLISGCVAHNAPSSLCVNTWLDSPQGSLDVWVFLKDDQHPPTLVEVSERVKERRALRGDASHPTEDRQVNPVMIEQLLEIGVTIRSTSNWLHAVSVRISSPNQLSQISELSFVSEVSCVAKHKREEDDREEMPSPVEFADRKRDGSVYGQSYEILASLSVPEIHEMGYTGEGILIMVIDSGFVTDHPVISRAQILDQRDFVNGDDDVSGDGSQKRHGTQTLSLIIGRQEGVFSGVAYDANVILAKTESLEYEELIEEDFFVQALEWGEKRGVDLISSSLGYNKFWMFGDYDGVTSVASRAIKIAFSKGVVVVMSIGNYGIQSISTPGDSEGALSVGSVNLMTLKKSSFSSVGPTSDGRIKPDVVAPGERVPVASSEFVPNDERTWYTRNSGTSFATPLIAGVAALVIQAHPDWKSSQVVEAIRRSATEADHPTVQRGWGFVNALAAINYRPAKWLTPNNCSSYCKHGTCENRVCVCNTGFYGLDCSFEHLLCEHWCPQTCYQSKCLCATEASGRCFKENITDWTCPISFYKDASICHFGCSPNNAVEDPDCKGLTVDDCNGQTEVLVSELSTKCNLSKIQEPMNEPHETHPEPEEPKFFSSKPLETVPKGEEAKLGNAIGFSTYIIGIVLLALLFVVYLRRKGRASKALTTTTEYPGDV
eukprot:TRINITY_DN7263_c0_g1_i2.p1 TRINITY_DN7263_c0_g1~~TRINITY_DN7263_c0_g1_i2.p1  ORF type:complete len:673 (+),score=129.05 TRINITY_DN7263_c0_g1_i2:3-2021(+)